jgi:S1-C subfamily serine protease
LILCFSGHLAKAQFAPPEARIAWGANSAPRADTVTSAAPHPSVARIIVPNRDGMSFGSGTLVDLREKHGLVLTNFHVVDGASDEITVRFPDGFVTGARLLKVDKVWDLAALAIWRPNCRAVPLAKIPPRPGDWLAIAGYGSGTYRFISGRCTQYFAPKPNFPLELVEVSVAARQGDSGGPIFNQQGELAGVLFGASYNTTMGSYCGRVREFLTSVLPADDGRTLLAARPSSAPLGSDGLTPLNAAAQAPNPFAAAPSGAGADATWPPGTAAARANVSSGGFAGSNATPYGASARSTAAPSGAANPFFAGAAPMTPLLGDSSSAAFRSLPSGLPPQPNSAGPHATFDARPVFAPAENSPETRTVARGGSATGANPAAEPSASRVPDDAVQKIWERVAGHTPLEQGKTILAGIGGLTLLVFVLRRFRAN